MHPNEPDTEVVENPCPNCGKEVDPGRNYQGLCNYHCYVAYHSEIIRKAQEAKAKGEMARLEFECEAFDLYTECGVLKCVPGCIGGCESTGEEISKDEAKKLIAFLQSYVGEANDV